MIVVHTMSYVVWSLNSIIREVKHLSSFPDPTTYSETTNLNFHEFFDQFEQMLQVYIFFSFLVFFIRNNLIDIKK